MFRFSTVFAWSALLGYDYLCFVNMSVVVTAGWWSLGYLLGEFTHGLSLGNNHRRSTEKSCAKTLKYYYCAPS